MSEKKECKLYRRDIVRAVKRKRRRNLEKRLLMLYNDGYYLMLISKAMGIPYTRVWRIINPPKLRNDRDAVIIKEFEQGMSIGELAAKYELSERSIYKILTKEKNKQSTSKEGGDEDDLQ